ncbi:MAG: cytidylate kinase-like family protein [Anaerolineae bacterium]|nr:cytidylate kinase-like family protein [Anaerolineae bacterium]
MSAISISRQMASKGDELAQQVAGQLNWRLVGYELINQAALAAGASHVALAEIDELGFFNLKPTTKERQAYQGQVEHIMQELVSEGQVIILGRGGQVILHNHPRVLHVRVVAPLEVRVAWLQHEKQFPPDVARICLAQSDRVRTRYLWKNYGKHLDDPTLYHLVINTGLLTLPQAVNLVVQTYRELETPNTTPASP